MAYAFDPELVDSIAAFPADIMQNYQVTRDKFYQLNLARNQRLGNAGVDISERIIPGPENSPDVKLRIYTPEGLDEPAPGLLCLHGGGFVLGDLEFEHSSYLRLCRELGIVAVAVDYRLAPEAPYPAALNDCFTALTWVVRNSSELKVDPERLGTYGQSAGACIAAALAILSRDEGGPSIVFQFLGIPVLDDRMQTESMRQFVDTPLWDTNGTGMAWDYYLGGAYKRGSEDVPCLASPARVESVAGLPPTYISTMEFDPLRDEGVLFALRLMQAGVPVELHCYPGTFHGSFMIAKAKISKREADEIVAVLHRGLHCS
jgi:acetyl esterase/lipase